MNDFFFNDTATTEIYTLSLHDALPILDAHATFERLGARGFAARAQRELDRLDPRVEGHELTPTEQRLAELVARSEEHTSELQSRQYLVCRLLLEKKKKSIYHQSSRPIF